MNLLRYLVVPMFAFFAMAPAWAAGARDRLYAFTTDLLGLDGDFTQRVYDADGRLTEESSGRVALAQPRQFRWEYLKPFPQLIVADGDQLWVYDPDLEQVTVRKQSLEEQRSPLAALIDPGELDRQFKVGEGGSTQGIDWLVLEPKQAEDAQFKRARLGFDSDGLARMEIEDALGQRTEIVYAGWRRNPVFPAGTFDYTPPEGVEVVGDPIEHAEVMPLKD